MFIESVEVLTVKVPKIHRPGAHAEAPEPMGESSYFIEKSWQHVYSLEFQSCFVKVTTNTGLVGWGEAQAPVASEVTAGLISGLLGHMVLGENPEHNEVLFAKMFRSQNVRGHATGYFMDAVAALDIAIWDLKAQSYGVPLFEALGGPFRTALKAYGSDLHGKSLEERKTNARRYTQDIGLSGVKLYLGRGVSNDIDEVVAIQEALEPDKDIYVDCLWRYGVSEATRLGRALDEIGVGFFEAPLQPEDRAGHVELARKLDSPVAVGEPLRHTSQFLDWMQVRAMKVAQPDVLRAGVTGCKKIADLANAFHVPVALHLGMSFGIGIAATWHVAASIENFLVQERQVRQAEIFGDLVEPPLETRDGRLLVPLGPGLGVKLDEEAISPHVVERQLIRRGSRN